MKQGDGEAENMTPIRLRYRTFFKLFQVFKSSRISFVTHICYLFFSFFESK